MSKRNKKKGESMTEEVLDNEVVTEEAVDVAEEPVADVEESQPVFNIEEALQEETAKLETLVMNTVAKEKMELSSLIKETVAKVVEEMLADKLKGMLTEEDVLKMIEEGLSKVHVEIPTMPESGKKCECMERLEKIEKRLDKLTERVMHGE